MSDGKKELEHEIAQLDEEIRELRNLLRNLNLKRTELAGRYLRLYGE